MDVGLGGHAHASKPKPLLPWHPPHTKLLLRHQNILEGVVTPGEKKPHKPLDQGGFFRKPGFHDEPYQISDAHEEAAMVPENFSSIQTPGNLKPRQRNKTSPAVELSFKVAKDLETQLRRSLRVDSYQEWFFGTARELVEAAILDPKEPQNLPRALALMLSGIRAMKDSNQVVSTILHNLVLLRRDASLDTLSRDVPREHLHLLRRHTLSDSRSLFDREAIDSARKAMVEAQQAKLLTSATTKQHYQPGSNKSSPRSGGHYTPPQRGSPRSQGGSPSWKKNGPQQWKKKGKRSPNGKGSPYRPPKGGGEKDK